MTQQITYGTYILTGPSGELHMDPSDIELILEGLNHASKSERGFPLSAPRSFTLPSRLYNNIKNCCC